MNDICYRIKKVRLSQLLSLTALAKRANISKSYLSEIESGKKKPSLDSLEKIAIALKMTASELLNYSICPFCGKNNQENDSLKAIIKDKEAEIVRLQKELLDLHKEIGK